MRVRPVDPAAAPAVFHGLVRTMAEVLDAEDGWPASHAGRVALLARRIATTMGLPEAAAIYYAALLHDVGGSGLDEHITIHAERGFAEPSAQAHPRLGADWVEATPLLAPLRSLIELHHERLDGGGFPFGRTGGELPIGATVIGLADSLEQALRMASPRDRRAAASRALQTAARGAAPGTALEAARAVIAADPGLLDALFDASAMRSAHDTPQPGYPGLTGLDHGGLITPLALALARLIDGRDHRTRGHSARVARYGFQIASALGADVIDPWDVAWAGLLHGVGAVAVPRRQLELLWAGDLEAIGRAQLRAVEIVGGLPSLEHLAHAIAAVRARWDGGGVPRGLGGEQIPLVARILAYADAYDAIAGYQSPTGPASHPQALERLREQVGPILDPHLAELALATLDRCAAVPPEAPAPHAWASFFTAESALSATPTAGPRPVGRGALLVDLEPWQAIALDETTAATAGRQALTELLGCAPEPDLAAALTPASATELRGLLTAATAGQTATAYLFTAAGRPVEVVALPSRDGQHPLLARAAANRLETMERLALFYRNFLASSEGVVFADPTGRILDVNRAFLDLFGYSLREVIGQHTRMLKSGRQPEAFYRQMWGAITDPAIGSWSGELIDRRRDGRELHVLMRISAVRDASGACVGYIAHHQDISERKRAEAELERRDAELVRKNAELERLNQFKTDMVAITSHDLKSPLAAIVGVAELLGKNLDRLPRERVTAYLDRIGDTARNLTTFINDLLDLEKIESGALALDRVPIHLDQLVLEAAEQARAAAAGRVSVEVTAPRLAPVAADPLRLEQVIGNLLANACKFAADGTAVELSVAAPDPARIRIEVADRGPGVPPAHLATIFERYYQTERKGGGSKRGSGQGLGLSIVRSLVELHRGRVWAENRPGGGCRFVVELPMDRDDPRLGQPVVVMLAGQTAEALEVLEQLAAAGAVVRRVDTLPELRRLQRVLEPQMVVVARAHLDADVIAHLETTGARPRPTQVLLDDEHGPGGPALLDVHLAPPVLPDEIRALLRHTVRGAT
jgi:PAS domain S-box-containing protein